MPLFQGDDDKASTDDIESREEKKQRKMEDRFRKEALMRLMGEDLGPSPAAIGLHVQTEAERKKKKKTEKRNAKRALERQVAKQAAANALDGPTPTNGDDILMIDVKPPPNDLERLKPAPSEDEDMEDGGAPLPKMGPGYTAPPSGVNRAVRRRFMLIERERAKIKKDLGVSEDSNEKADEVQQLLAEFTGRLDAKTAERETNKKDRKRREAARLHDRRDRVLDKTPMKERRERPRVPRDT